MSWFFWFLLINYIVLCFGLYKLFAKAAENPILAFIPGYNFVVWCKVIGRPAWWALLLLIPIVNVFIYAGMAVDMVRSFGQHSFLHSFLAVVFAPFYFTYLGFQDDIKYDGPILDHEKEYAAKIMEAQEKGSARQLEKLRKNNPYAKSGGREWAESIIFAVFAAALIRMFLIEAYVIPTSSMEGSLMVGDFLFVSKAHYGIRTPKTIAMLPLLHNRAPMGLGESYWEKPSLNYHRLPALESIDHNDPVVFNLPSGDSVYVFPDRTWTAGDVRYGAVQESNPQYDRMIKSGQKKLITRPIDKKDHYIKRAIGLPGDSLQIIDRQVYINGQPGKNPKNMQFLYRVVSPNETNLNIRNFTEWGISEEDLMNMQEPGTFAIFMNEEQKNKVQSMDANISIVPIDWEKFPKNPYKLFPHDPNNFPVWTVDNFGPIYIPKAGVTVPISPKTIAPFQRIIDVYEDNDLEFRNGQVYINGEVATSYTFQQDYYWMMGDNRHNSEDSRVWGYVPADHVVGKPLFIWFSLREGSLAKGVNWKRVFSRADKE